MNFFCKTNTWLRRRHWIDLQVTSAMLALFLSADPHMQASTMCQRQRIYLAFQFRVHDQKGEKVTLLFTEDTNGIILYCCQGLICEIFACHGQKVGSAGERHWIWGNLAVCPRVVIFLAEVKLQQPPASNWTLIAVNFWCRLTTPIYLVFYMAKWSLLFSVFSSYE